MGWGLWQLLPEGLGIGMVAVEAEEIAIWAQTMCLWNLRQRSLC